MKSLSHLLSDWRKSSAALEKLQNDTPRIIGVESVKVVKDNFKLQGYDNGGGVNAWPERAESTNKKYDSRSGVKGTVFNSSNPILIQTHNLLNAVKYYLKTKAVTVGVDLGLVPYAKRHNEGEGDTPARKFIPANGEGPNRKIMEKVRAKISRERKKAMDIFKR